ncbi:MAG: M15 family metallopeptidase [Mycobacteriales bacterium]
MRRPATLRAAICLLIVSAFAASVLLPDHAPRAASLSAVLTPSAQASVRPLGIPLVDPQPASLATRLRPDVLVSSSRPLPAAILARLAAATPSPQHFVSIRAATMRVGPANLIAWGVDPAAFRGFTSKATAESDGVWASLADGNAVMSHSTDKALGLPLGSQLSINGDGVPLTSPLRLGAVATTGLPGVSVLVSDAAASSLGFPAANTALLSAGQGDPLALTLAARRIVGSAATVRQLTPSHQTIAVLSGGPAARSLGSFNYRYFPNGTIAPDPAWIRANIVLADVPILGQVRCHRLIIPQLRAALTEVVAAGLAGSIHPGEYAGCYNPRFIDRDPRQPISLHTWGIALDLNVPGNQRGTAGQMDRRVVTIFKRWGFGWGGDWAYTDPMHFEVSSLVTPR